MGQSEGSICVRGFRGGRFAKVKVTFEADTKVAIKLYPNQQALLYRIVWLFGADFFFFYILDLGNYASRTKAATAWP